MTNFLSVSLLCFTLFFGACKQGEREVGPDLATALISKSNATYLITTPLAAPVPLQGANAVVKFDRVNNNTLNVTVRIDDGAVQVDEQYRAAVVVGSAADDGLLITGLRNVYKLKADHLNKMGYGVSHVYLYEDGKVRGGVSYVNAAGQLIMLSFIP
jgi:hypothetical protein